MTSQAVIDTHFHLWELERFNYEWPNADNELTKIYKNFLPDDYESERKNTPIKYGIFVEVHESIEEIEWILKFTENSFIKGVVGGVDLTSNQVEANIIRLKKNPAFVGVRKVLDLCEDGWIEREDVLNGMKVLAKHDLAYDLLIRTRSQYESAKKFLKKAPQHLRVVIDHLGKPNAKTGASEEWYTDIKTMAQHPNVYCKLSGMVTEANLDNWKPRDFKNYVEHVLKHFGVNRVMFGSDWPVCKLANANLLDVYNLLSDLLKELSEEERRKVFYENAIKFYKLNI